MSEFIDEPMMLKETDSDMYMLLPLTVNDLNELVIDDSGEDAIKLLDELENRMKKHPEITGLVIEDLKIPDINSLDDLLEKFMSEIIKLNFRTLVTTQIMKCFPELNEENTQGILDDREFTHYGLFSYNNILNYMRYLLIGSYTLKSNDEILYPYSFLSMKHFDTSENVKTRDTPSSEWNATDYHIIYNVCKSHKINKKGICTHMMDIVTSSKYAEKPLVLFVDETNKAAINCYTKNHFQLVVDVFSGKDETRPTSVYRESEKNIFMCYNRKALKVSAPNQEGQLVDYELMPIGSYRITLIAHGAVDLSPDIVFEPDYKASDHYRQYQFPFKNIQYYAKLGLGLSLMEGVDEATAIYDVCYDNIVSKYQDTPKNKILSTLPLFFSGFNKDKDPPSREHFMGLYDCNMKTRIKENHELFGKENDQYVHFNELMQMIYVYCNDKDISLDNVEIKIFACRGFCPIGEFAQMAAPDRQPTEEVAEMTNEGGNGENTYEMESIKDYKSMEKDEFFKYLKDEMSSCPLPTKTGGDVLSSEFMKLLNDTPVGETFTHNGKTYEVLPNKHYKTVGESLSGEFIKSLTNTPVGETFIHNGKTYEVLPNKHYKKVGGKKTRRKRGARRTKKNTRSKK